MTRLTRQQKADAIGVILDDLYPETPIPLNHDDPYTLLIGVVLSAQSTDKKVNEITPLLFEQARTPAGMIQLDVDEIRAIIKPVGLSPRKSKAIWELSRILIEQHDSQVPQSFEALEALPGVGHKTASVVMNQAFGVPAFAVDTHIHRLAYRWTLSTGKNVEKTEVDCKKVFARELWGKRHLQIIFFGREHCPARSHDPNVCPICSQYGRKSLFRSYNS